MQALLKATMASLMVALLSGCATPLMKGSPFYTGSVVVGMAKTGEQVRWDDPAAAEVKELTLAETPGGGLDANRINIWPLFYQNLLISSILWPMVEFNDVGWEVRPLVSVDRYRQQYQVLLGGYDAKEPSHYCFPLYRRSPGHFTSLLYIKDGDTQVVPAALSYWDQDSFGILCPLSNFNTATGKSYVFPLYAKNQHDFYSLPYIKKGDTQVVPALLSYWGQDRLGILCPLSRFNTATGNGYVFPLYFRNDRGWYSLLVGAGKDFRYVLPPLLVMTGTDGDQPSYHACWPLFSTTPAKQEYSSFPLFNYQGSSEAHPDWTFNYLMPLGWTGRKGKTTHAVFFPLCFYESGSHLFTALGGWTDDGDTVAVVPPLFIKNRDQRETDYHLLWPFGLLRLADREKDPAAATLQGHFFPLLSSYRRDGYRSRFLCFPMYFDGEEKTDTGTSTWRCLLPFYYGYEDPKCRHTNWGMLAGTKTATIVGEKYDSSYLLPFYYHDWAEKTQWTWDEQKKESIPHESACETRFILPGIITSRNPTKDTSSLVVLPVYSGRREGSKSWDRTLLWLFTREADAAAGSVSSQALWNFIRYDHQAAMAEQKRFTRAQVLPLFIYRRDEVESRTTLFPLYFAGTEKLDTGTKSWRCLLPFYYGYEDPQCRHSNWGMLAGTKTATIAGEQYSSCYLLPLYYHGWAAETDAILNEETKEMVPRESARETRLILPGIITSRNPTKDTSSLVVLPVYSGRREGSKTWDSTLLWLFTRQADVATGSVEAQAFWYFFHYEHQAAKEAQPEYASTRILWKLYHRERRGGEVNTDFFPFVSCSRGPEHSRFAFAWRFFSYDRTAEATRVHLLFLPVWW